jgi:hypothetical protein
MERPWQRLAMVAQALALLHLYSCLLAYLGLFVMRLLALLLTTLEPQSLGHMFHQTLRRDQAVETAGKCLWSLVFFLP